MKDEKNMFYGAQPIIFELAKQLRDRQTEAEIYLWDHLKFLNIPNIKLFSFTKCKIISTAYLPKTR